MFYSLGCTALNMGGCAGWSHPLTGAGFLFIPSGTDCPPDENRFFYRIHEDIWKHRNSAVLNRLGALCGKNERVHGRQCRIHRLDKSAAQSFLDLHHVGGYVTAYYKYGLYFKGQLLAVATFSKGRTLHLEGGRKSYELLRFATASGYSIAGGLARLMRHFCLETGATHLMTYADKEWTDGKTYRKLGFRLAGTTPPLTFLVNTLTSERMLMTTAEIQAAGPWIEVKNMGNLKLVLDTL